MTVTHDIKHYIIVCTVTPLPKKVALGLNLLAVFASPCLCVFVVLCADKRSHHRRHIYPYSE